MKLYLIRHGKTLANTRGLLYYGDEGLSQEGIEDLHNIKHIYKDIKIDYLYCSDLKRAIETAAILFTKSVDEYREDIQEFNFCGEKECSLPKGEMKFKAKQDLYDLGYVVIDDSRDAYDFFVKRIKDFILEVQSKGFENIVVVSHGLAIGQMLKTLFPLDRDIFDLVVRNGVGYEIDFDKEGNPISYTKIRF